VKKITKWGIGLVVTLAMMFMVGQASAVTLGMYDTGQLVPKVFHDGESMDTVVGLTCVKAGGCTVYWTFFDVDSTHITDGIISMTENDYEPFSWMAESGFGLEKVDGYLVFTSGTANFGASRTNDIFANAFMVNMTGSDAVFIPVVPLDNRDYVPGVDVRFMDAASIIQLTAGTRPGRALDIRYWIDTDYCANTKVVLWSVCDVSGTYTVNIFDDAENWKSLNFVLLYEELNLMDPSTLLGRPAGFIDGFIHYTVPAGACVAPEIQNDMFVFSYIDSSLIGAMQTLLAGEIAGGGPVPPGPCETIINGETVDCATDCPALFPGNIPVIVQCEAWQGNYCPCTP
jgi:hypothetical protein